MNRRIIPIVLAILAVPAGALAIDCNWCQEQRKQESAKQAEIKRNDELLGKNREYLTYLEPEEASKFIKVDSNIKMILIQRDKLKRELASIDRTMEEKGCEQCK